MIKRPLCLMVLFFLGIQLIWDRGFQESEDLKPSFLEENIQNQSNITLTGTVFRREIQPNRSLYYITDTKIYLKNQIKKESDILVYFKQNHLKNQQQNIEYKQPKIGNKIKLTGQVRFFESSRNPGNFDQKSFYEKQGIQCSVWTDAIEIKDVREWIIKEKLCQFREKWKILLEQTMGTYYGGCMSAILLGDKNDLDTNVKELYQKSGIGHILAISGLHMSFLGTGLYWLLRRAGLSFWVAGLAGSSCLIAYTIMIEGGISAQRALIMFVIRIGADVAGRDYDLLTSLSVAAFIIIFKQPLYLYDAGFLMSFGALIGVGILYPVFEEQSLFPKVLRMGMAIQVILFPILLYFYYEIPIYSLILNVMVIPLMSVILSIGILGSCLILFLPFGKSILNICKWILWGYEKAAEITLQIPFGRIIFGQPSKIWCVIYYIILLGGCIIYKIMTRNDKNYFLKRKQSLRKKKTILCGGILLYAVVFGCGTILGHGIPGGLAVTAVDVGQGDCFYIRTPKGSHMLIDGGSTSVSEVGKYRIVPFLKSQGVRRLDYVFVSHGDEDHIGGIEEILCNQELGIFVDVIVFPAESVLDERLMALAQIAEKNGTKVATIHEGEQLEEKEMKLKCLAPASDYKGALGNEASMVLELRYQSFDMLFTGDLEGNGEQQLVKSGLLRNYDVLKAGHHGSKNSSSQELLEIVCPEVTIFSAGEENPYGHPHKETEERLRQMKSKMYGTKDLGAIRIWSNGKTMKVSSYLGKTFAKK